MNNKCAVELVLPATPVSLDLAVNVSRIIGTQNLTEFDPFLLVDGFQKDTFTEGDTKRFPPRPHRGFETMTYLFSGEVEYKDSSGNLGTIQSGGVKWMTAGSGVILSEIPQERGGTLQGIQLWINLPEKQKMIDPSYQLFNKSDIPIEQRDSKTQIIVVSGKTSLGTVGPIQSGFTDTHFFDITLTDKAEITEKISSQFLAVLLTCCIFNA